MKFIFGGVIIGIILSSCSGDQYKVSQQAGGVTNRRVCVVTPKDGEFEHSIYQGSGEIVAKKIHAVLQQNNHSVTVVKYNQNLNGLEACIINGSDYAIEPTIIHWEDRVTGWSGKPDIVKIHLKAYALKSKAYSHEVTFENKTNVLVSAFVEWGNFGPQSLLDEKFNKTVMELFQKLN